ncbi:MAG: PKD domain-containing protein [Planctomycetes bacterium]|nr:PKD domain-containing protein [Planctomycetota bacterium]
MPETPMKPGRLRPGGDRRGCLGGFVPHAAFGLLILGLAACEGDGGSDSPDSPIAVGSAPLAIISVDAVAGEVPLEVHLDGSQSMDPDGDITTYRWDCGDGSPVGYGPAHSHVYSSEGEYTVALTVRDSTGITSTAETTVRALSPACPDFAEGVSLGAVESESIVEASGIAASRGSPGVLWVHNDSGDLPRIFALRDDGRHLGTYEISGAQAIDWEDIAVGPGPEDGEEYIYIGDIGDNAKARPFVTVYRVPEPDVDPLAGSAEGTLVGAERLEMVYPEGPSDAECLFVDPRTADVYIVTKRSDGLSRVYRDSHPHPQVERTTMELVATLALGTTELPGSTLVTAGDISPTGSWILLRTYSHAFLWRRAADEPVGAAFLGETCRVASRSESQGEAIGFASDSAAYFTVSEGSHPSLYYFGLAEPSPN